MIFVKMNENREAFVRDLINESDALVSRFLEPNAIRILQYSEILKVKPEFEKLVKIIRGLPPNEKWISLEITLSYNYCYVLLLLLRVTDSSPASSCKLETAKNCDQQSRINAVETFDDFLKSFLFRVSCLKVDKLIKGVASDKTKLSSAYRIIDLLMAVWIPGSAKISLISLCVLCCIWLTECSRHRDSTEICDRLLRLFLPRAEVLFQIDSIDPVLGLPCISDTEVPSTNLSVIADTVRFLSAKSFFNLLETHTSLSQLRKIETYPLRLYSSYAEGYILYMESSFDEAFNLMAVLVKHDNLSPELMLMARNLIGCCLSSQGRHRSAIQVFKKCLRDDFQFHVAMYNIALQYRKLLLFDAELEMLQLLAKLILEDKQNPVCDNVLLFCADSFGSDQLLTLSSFALSSQDVLYIYVRRLVDLQRYEEAVHVYLELFSSFSSSESQSCISLPSMQSLYSQAIHSCIKAAKFNQAIQLCDTMLAKSNLPPSDSVTDCCTRFSKSGRKISSTSASIEADNRPETFKNLTKRLHEAEDERARFNETTKAGIDDDMKIKLFDAGILLYNSEALINLGRRNESLLSIERAVDILESVCKQNKADSEGNQPLTKRIKSDLTVDPEETEHENSVLHQMTSDAYSLKAIVLITLDRLQDALHWSRLAYQLQNRDTDKVYNLTLLLYKLQRNSEATSLWLSHRGLLPASNDALQLDLLIKQCSAKVKEMALVEPTTSTNRHWCLLDTEALRMKMSAKHRS